ncbi:MAG: hypothetical protein K0S76_1980 [Herbinix sp.]|jgi:hypothetical protein|nr:hypothetical protein [Herbinix sp.]
MEKDASLCRIHINTGEIEKLDIEGNIVDYFVSDGFLYYVKWPVEGINKMNPETKESKLIIENPNDTYQPYIFSFLVDEDYIYYENAHYWMINKEEYEKECRIYNKEGEFIDVISFNDNKTVNEIVMGINGNKLVVPWREVTKEGQMTGYYGFDKSLIGTGKLVWEPVIPLYLE